MLDRSVPTIKADQARATFGVSGRGIGVVILDSGIDGRYQPDVLCVTGVPCAPAIHVENLPISETSARASIAMSCSRACVTGEVRAWKM